MTDTYIARVVCPPSSTQLLRIAGLGRDQWAPVVETYIGDQAIKILRFPKDKVLDPEQPLLDVGLDSLLAVELKNAIMDGGVDVAVARVMTGPPIRHIGQMVLTALDEGPPVVETARQEVVANGIGADPSAAGRLLVPVWVVFATAILGPVLVLVVYALTVRFSGYQQTAYTAPEVVQEEAMAAERPSSAGSKAKTPKRKAP